MQLGIYAPYDRGEQTAMAVRLAFTAARAGWTVRWLASTRSADPVHPHWDDRVRLAAEPKRLLTWATRCDCRVWFEPNRATLLAAREVAESQDVLVPSWHGVSALNRSEMTWALTSYDAVVYASAGAYRGLKLSLAPAAYLHGQCVHTVCRWPSGMRPACRQGPRDAARPTVAFVADNRTCRHHGRGIVEVVACCLEMRPTLCASVCLDYAPDRTEFRAWRALLQAYAPGGRLSLRTRSRTDELLATVFEADWLVNLSTRSDCGLLVTQAQAMGVPPIAWAVAPFTDVIGDGSNEDVGIVVPCNMAVNAAEAETASWYSPMMAATVVHAMNPEANLLPRMQERCRRRAESVQDQDFKVFWDKTTEMQEAAG